MVVCVRERERGFGKWDFAVEEGGHVVKRVRSCYYKLWPKYVFIIFSFFYINNTNLGILNKLI